MATFRVYADSNLQKLKKTPFNKLHSPRLIKTAKTVKTPFLQNSNTIRTPFSENKLNFLHDKNNDFINKSNLKATSSKQFQNIKKVNAKLNFRDDLKPETPVSQFGLEEFLWEEDNDEIEKWYSGIKKKETNVFDEEIGVDLLSCTMEEEHPPPLIAPDVLSSLENEYSAFPTDFI